MKNQQENDSVAVGPFSATQEELPPSATVDGTAGESRNPETAMDSTREGVPVICLGAPGESIAGFLLLQQLAPSGCRVLLLEWPEEEWPGQSGSAQGDLQASLDRAVDFLAAFLHSRQIRRPILLGAKWGAAVAIAFALRCPGKISGLILSKPLGLVFPRPFRHASTAFKGIAKAIFGQGKNLSPRQTSQANAAFAQLSGRLRAGLSEISCPVLVAISKSNQMVPLLPLQQLLTELDAGRGQLRLAVFAGRRSPLKDDPERMARIVSGFAAATLPLEQHRHAWTLAQVDWPARGLNQWTCTHPGCRAELALPIGENPNSRN